MLDWDTLIPDDRGQAQPSEGGTGRLSQSEGVFVPPLVGRQESSSHAGFSPVLGAVPVVPSKNVEEGIERGIEDTPTGWGEAKSFRVRKEGQADKPHPVDPSALLLCLAWCGNKAMPEARRWLALSRLERRPPAEQVRVWSKVCRRAGLKPWRVLAIPTPGEGKDCTLCRHFVQVVDRIPGGDRREFHWSCGLGYLILELGRATERVLIAPPECERWVRFYPGPVR